MELDAIFGCALWCGRLDRDGYPLTDDGERAHRVAYEATMRPLKDGEELEHECRRRRCVQPKHLTPVDRSTNEKLKSWRFRVRNVKCRFGHDMRTNAMVTPEGGRVCRSCR